MTELVAFSALPSSLQGWLCAQLRGTAGSLPADVTAADHNALVHFAAQAGLHPYLWHQQQRQNDYPAAFAQQWQPGYLIAQVITRLRTQELERVLTALQRHQIRVVVLKGAALAHQLYPEPALRPAADIDLWVEPRAELPAQQVLLALGYHCEQRYNFEAQFDRLSETAKFTIDLHWRFSDSPFLSPLFAFDELYARAERLNGLTITAYGLGKVDALVNASTHYAKDRDRDHFIWLLDLDLLLRKLTATELEEFIQRAQAKGCSALCHAALSRARAILDAPVSDAALAQLAQSGETTAYLLDARRDVYREFAQLLRASPWRRRAALLWQACFPPLHMIHTDHKPQGDANLSLIHLRRLSRLPQRIFRYYQHGT
ncbi:MAG: nucleotidyltransferase family protein [Acidobacteria bacterium]|nr:nucleotidyltransferase family protein [Acidobacteriota bacterium]